jgi:hypothetical protein
MTQSLASAAARVPRSFALTRYAFGKMRTTWVRRLISSFRRSSRLVDFRCL